MIAILVAPIMMMMMMNTNKRMKRNTLRPEDIDGAYKTVRSHSRKTVSPFFLVSFSVSSTHLRERKGREGGGRDGVMELERT